MDDPNNRPGTYFVQTLAVADDGLTVAMPPPKTLDDRPPVPSPAAIALMRALEAVKSLEAALNPHLDPLPLGTVLKITVDPVIAHRAMHGMSRVLHRFPKLAATSDPEAMDVDLTVAAAAEALAFHLQMLMSNVEDTRRVALDRVWSNTLEGYHVANRVARTDSEVKAYLAPVRAAFARPSRVKGAPITAADLNRRAEEAALRAANARHKADLAKAKAAAVGIGFPDLPPPKTPSGEPGAQ